MIMVSYAGYPYSVSSLMPDNGLASLAGALIQNGHEVTILDYSTVDLIDQLVPTCIRPQLARVFDFFNGLQSGALWKSLACFAQLKAFDKVLEYRQRRVVRRLAIELAELVRRQKLDFVGFKLWNGDGFEGTAVMAREVRRQNPQVKIFGGGPHAYSFKSLLLDYLPQLDALSLDESENTIVGLADFAAGKGSLADVPNIVFRDGAQFVATPLCKIQDLDSLAFPVYSAEVYPSLYTPGKLRVGVIDESRGCLYSCPFCIQSSREDNRFRAKSPERIVAEIQNLSRAGYRLFRFGGQMTPGALLEAVCKGLLAAGTQVAFSCFGHVSCLRNVDFDLLRRGGLKSLFLGIESADEDVMVRAIGRKFCIADAETAITAARNAGIAVVISLIHPLPFSNRLTVDRNIEFLTRARPDSVLVYFPGVYPNTPWACEPEKYGIGLAATDIHADLLRYKIKHQFPPRFWKPLPYKIDGKTFRHFSAETEDFARLLRKAGHTLFVTDEVYVGERKLHPHHADHARRWLRDRLYQKYGYRLYAPEFCHSEYGWVYPMVLLLDDMEHLAAVGSPLYEIAAKYPPDGVSVDFFRQLACDKQDRGYAEPWSAL